MEKFVLVLSILFFTACGIDKESPPPLPSTNNAGQLDTNFFSNGFNAIDGSAGGSGNDQIYALTKDSQGRIVAVGASHNGSDLDMTVWRLSANGSLDTSFGSNGVFSHDSAAGGSSTDLAYGVITDSNDNIYITGTSFNGADFDMAVWKLDSSGNLDTSFNGTGVFVDDNAAGGTANDQGSSIVIDGSGRLVVAGFSDRSLTNRDMAVWRITTAGTLDNSFATLGILTHNDAAGGNDDDLGNDLKIDGSGNIYVVGQSVSPGSQEDMTVWKLTESGTLDPTFDDDGILTHNGAAGGNGPDAANAVVMDESGSLVITGYSRNASANNDMALWRVLPNGSLDTTFDADGFTSFDVGTVVGGTTNDQGSDIIINSEGGIVIAGSGNDNFCTWRYDENGELDELYNTDGFFSHDSAAGGFGIDAATSLVEDESQRLVFGGYSENSSNNFDATFWRLR